MDRSERFQMFVYLLCSHYKTVYSGAGSFPVALFPQEEGGWGEGSNGGVVRATVHIIPTTADNQRERAQGCCQNGKKLLYSRYFALKAVSPHIFAIIVVQPFKTYRAHREQLDGGPGPAAWRPPPAAQRPSC